MKLMLCSIDYKPQDGGVAEFMYNIGKSLSESGIDVNAVAFDIEGAANFDKCNKYFHTYRVPEISNICSFSFKRIITRFVHFVKTLGGLINLYKYISKILDEKGISHTVCFHWDVFGVVSFFIRKKRNIPYYVVVHGLDVLRKENKFVWLSKYYFQWSIQRLVLNNANGIFVNSQYTKDIVLKDATINKSIYVVNCGVDIKRFIKSHTRPLLFNKLDVGNAKILLSITRLVKRKGIDNAIKAFAEVLRKHKDLKMLYLIGGIGPDYERLKNIVDELGLRDRVVFFGFISEEQKNEFYNLADVFIMPSREEKDGDVEGFGIVFLEANACGKPVIAGNSGGVADAVKDGYSGLLVNPLDIQDIVSKIERLSMDEVYAAKLGAQGRERVENSFTWDIVARRFESVIMHDSLV